MLCIIQSHSQYTTKQVGNLAKEQVKLCDAYDKANDRKATQILLKSLGDDLKREVKNGVEVASFTFLEAFIHLADFVAPTSVADFEDKKKKLKARTHTDFAGEDMVSLMNAYYDDYKALDEAGAYDPSLGLHMLTVALQAGGTDNEDYRQDIREMRNKMDEIILSGTNINAIINIR